MAYTTINKSTDYFNTKLYTGNGTTSQNITGVGFQPDLVWIKNRGTTDDNVKHDAVRGAGKRIKSNATAAESTVTNQITSFDSDGFTTSNSTDTGANSNNYVAWNWKANGAGSANTDGSINSTVSVNTTAGFSIVSWTGNGSASTIGHGLGVTPKMILLKNRSEVYGWQVYHSSLGNTKYLALDSTDAQATSSQSWNNTSPTSSVFSVGASDSNNKNGNYIIAYCFAEKTGYSKFGSYTGNGNADGTFIYTGFKPKFVIGKRSSDTEDWYLFDSTRDDRNVMYKLLYPNGTNAEYTGATRMDFLSNGFKQYNTDNKFNHSGSTYIYMAFGQSLVGSNNVPATAR